MMYSYFVGQTSPEYIQIFIDGPLCSPEHLSVSSQNLMLMLLGKSPLHSFTRDQLHQNFSRTLWNGLLHNLPVDSLTHSFSQIEVLP